MTTRLNSPAVTSRTPADHDVADYKCSAQYCPARATIFDTLSGPPRNGRCRYHDAAPPAIWPTVTALLNRTQSVEETNSGLKELGLAVRVPDNTSIETSRVHTEETPQQIIGRLQAMLRTPKDPDDWWKKLRSRERAGELLLPIQRSAWRAAELSCGPDQSDAELLSERQAIQSEGNFSEEF